MISTISCHQTTRLLAFKTLRYTFFCVNNTNGWMTHHWFYGRWSLLCILDPTPSSIRDMLSLFHVILVLSSFPYPLDQYKMYRFIIHLKKNNNCLCLTFSFSSPTISLFSVYSKIPWKVLSVHNVCILISLASKMIVCPRLSLGLLLFYVYI